MIHFYLRCSYYKIKIILRKNCKNEVIRVYTSFSESSRVYTSMSSLIFEHIIVFTNDSFIIQIETESSLTEPNRAELTSGRAHLTPLIQCIIEKWQPLSLHHNLWILSVPNGYSIYIRHVWLPKVFNSNLKSILEKLAYGPVIKPITIQTLLSIVMSSG